MTAIRQAVVVSDLHCGCQFGLCPPEVTLDGGGSYRASGLQGKVWRYWDQFWNRYVPRVTRSEPWVLILNGDAIDGVHHGVNTLATSNISDQVGIAEACLRGPVSQAAALYVVRGTEVHVGQSGEDEETLAKRLGAKPDANGRHSRFELRLKLGEALVDVQHHIATVNSNAYETTALTREFVTACEEAGRNGQQRPDCIIRSHRHRYAETRVPVKGGYGIVATCPGWQLKTPLTYRMPGARQALPQFGGLVLRYGDEDGLYVRARVWTIERTPIEVPEVANA